MKHTARPLTEAEYADLRARYDAAPHGGDTNNEDREAIEVYEWLNNPPARYFVYVTHEQGGSYRATGTVTNFTGALLGTCVLGPIYYSGYGEDGRNVGTRTRRPITVSGTNGIRYFGTFYVGAGDYARLYAYTGAQNARPVPTLTSPLQRTVAAQLRAGALFTAVRRVLTDITRPGPRMGAVVYVPALKRARVTTSDGNAPTSREYQLSDPALLAALQEVLPVGQWRES